MTLPRGRGSDMAAPTAAPPVAPTSQAPRAQRPRSRTAATVRMYLGVAVIVLWGLIPFYWMLVTSLRDVEFTFSNEFWPTHITMDNFETVFSTARGNHFGQALVNSFIIGAATTTIALLVGIFAAYALANLKFRGKFVVMG